MNYELAKKLKEAGFPQTGLSGCWATPETSIDPKDQVYSPGLSELIEECRKTYKKPLEDMDVHFQLSSYSDNTWITGFFWYEVSNIQTEGETPKEAVVRLYLEINKLKRDE